MGVKCSRDKWLKTKVILGQIENLLCLGAPLDQKELERQQAFLVHVACTYPTMVPYVKSLHATIQSWYPNHDRDGWKSSENDFQECWVKSGRKLSPGVIYQGML